MKEETRRRAFKKLVTVKPSGSIGDFFKNVWVVNDRIFFMHNAARRKHEELKTNYPDKEWGIELVTIEEAFAYYGTDYEKNKNRIAKDPMEGELYEYGELYNKNK